jgi:hypothetical protein
MRTFDVDEVEVARAPRTVGAAAQLSRGSGVEAARSNCPALLNMAPGHGLMAAVHVAYQEHHPLVLSPDDVWLALAQAFSVHVVENAKTLRHKFVRNTDKLELLVERHDFVAGSPDNPWDEAVAAFVAQIRQHIGRQTDLVVASFSTTGVVERTSSEIVLGLPQTADRHAPRRRVRRCRLGCHP